MYFSVVSYLINETAPCYFHISVNLLFVEYTESRTLGDGLKAQEREDKDKMKTPTLSRKSFDSRLSEKSQYSCLFFTFCLSSVYLYFVNKFPM